MENDARAYEKRGSMSLLATPAMVWPTKLAGHGSLTGVTGDDGRSDRPG